jgi:hypothetical protein
MIPEALQFTAVTGNAKVTKMAMQYRPKPFPNQRNRSMEPSFQLGSKFAQLPLCSLPYFMPPYDELSFLGSTAYVRKTQKIKCLRLAQSFAFAVYLREASKFNQPGFISMQFEIEFFKALNERFLEWLGLMLVLKAHHKVIAKPHDYDIAGCTLLPPVLRPKAKTE